ncbi:MAG: hypothetical protein FWB75_00980 [Oscillospiraceae bacterium]|nr:hypothetical protein [Oscillospiraceae bacterium]
MFGSRDSLRIPQNARRAMHVDLENETLSISGLDNVNLQFFIPGVNASWQNLGTGSGGTWDITNLIGAGPRTVIVGLNEANLIGSFDLPARPAAPATPVVVYNDSGNPGMAVLMGMTEAMEYRLPSSPAWTPSDGSDVVFDIPASNQTLQVRFIRTGAVASMSRQLTLLAPGAAPNVTVNTTAETIGTVTANMELSTDGINWAPIGQDGTAHDISAIIDSAVGGSLTIYVRSRATETAPLTQARLLTVHPRLAAPTTPTLNPITFVLAGTNNTMQWQQQGASAWTNIAGASINLANLVGASDSIVLVRFRPTAANSASLPIEIVLPALREAPAQLTLNTATERLDGGIPGRVYQHSVNATAWTNVTAAADGSIAVTGLIAANARDVHIREAATALLPFSDHATFTLPGRRAAPAAPALVFNSTAYPDQAVLTGLDSTMEFRLSTTAAWTAFDGAAPVFNIPAATQTYQIRIMATEDNFVSTVRSIPLPARRAAPNVTINTTTERLAGVTTAHEVSINGAPFVPVTAEMVTAYTAGSLISEMIDALSAGQTATLNFRLPATQALSASHPRTVTLFSRLQPPTTLQFNNATFTLTGTTNAMQWQLQGATAWTNITATTLNLTAQIQRDSERIIYVRFRPTASNSASNHVVITLPMMDPAPSGLSLDLANELVVGGVPGRVYQHSVNATAWTSITAGGDGSFSIAGLVTASARNVHIREAATATAPFTDHVTIVLPGRPAAPTAGVFVFNNPTYPDQAVLMGLDSRMEFRLGTTAAWTAFDGSNPVVGVPAANQTYQIRFRGTGGAFPSAVRSLTLTARAAAPNVTVNTTTERLSGVTVNHEVSINGGPFTAVTGEMAAGFTTGTTIADMTDDIAPGSTVTLSFRIPAIDSRAASNARVITLFARPDAPTAPFAFNVSTNRITGATTAMMWRVPGGNWTNATTSITPPAGWTVLEFAFRPTASAARSWVTVFARPDAASLDVNVQGESETLLEDAEAYPDSAEPLPDDAANRPGAAENYPDGYDTLPDYAYDLLSELE